MIRLNEMLRRKDEEGFTLIELMVVVLIIAILIAIAIPTFLGARGRAQDRAAQSSLRNAVTGAKAIFTDDEDYADANTAQLALAEPALQFVAAATQSDDPPNEVSTDGGTSPSSVFIAAAKSANGDHCWYIMDRVNPSSTPGTWWALVDTAVVTCSASTPPSLLAANFNTAGAATAGQWVRQPGDALP